MHEYGTVQVYACEWMHMHVRRWNIILKCNCACARVFKYMGAPQCVFACIDLFAIMLKSTQNVSRFVYMLHVDVVHVHVINSSPICTVCQWLLWKISMAYSPIFIITSETADFTTLDRDCASSLDVAVISWSAQNLLTLLWLNPLIVGNVCCSSALIWTLVFHSISLACWDQRESEQGRGK